MFRKVAREDREHAWLPHAPSLHIRDPQAFSCLIESSRRRDAPSAPRTPHAFPQTGTFHLPPSCHSARQETGVGTPLLAGPQIPLTMAPATQHCPPLLSGAGTHRDSCHVSLVSSNLALTFDLMSFTFYIHVVASKTDLKWLMKAYKVDKTRASAPGFRWTSFRACLRWLRECPWCRS